MLRIVEQCINTKSRCPNDDSKKLSIFSTNFALLHKLRCNKFYITNWLDFSKISRKKSNIPLKLLILIEANSLATIQPVCPRSQAEENGPRPDTQCNANVQTLRRIVVHLACPIFLLLNDWKSATSDRFCGEIISEMWWWWWRVGRKEGYRVVLINDCIVEVQLATGLPRDAAV